MKLKKVIICILVLSLFLINNYSYSYNEDKLNLYSQAAILMESSTGKILYSKDAEVTKYPASTTKILTAILVIEKCNLEDEICASYSAINSIPSGYSNASIKVGEILTADQLLQVFLVHSANEAGFILAEHLSGSINEFAKLMNEKAKEIGCKNTNFTNPSGIHDTNHYSTAYDMCLIARYCMQNPIFRNYVSMPSCTIAPTNKSEQRHFYNTNELLNPSDKYYNPNVTGIKTGFTTPAKNCLISGYYEDGIELISVVLGAPHNTTNNLSAKFIDTTNLFNFGMENYKKVQIAEKSSVLDTINIKNAEIGSNRLDVILENEVYAIVPSSFDVNTISSNMKIAIKDDLSAPITANDIVGTVTYTIDGTSYTQNLLAGSSIKPSSTILNLLKIILALILLYMAYKFMYGNYKNSKRSSKKKKKLVRKKYNEIKY
ncbi:MAG: D-alanyl-D-alanine carboxypeptidase [Clostridia bacterium]|nr:D-alanyl-D-alanine carboxypeptidase [Clostridia bacterium]